MNRRSLQAGDTLAPFPPVAIIDSTMAQLIVRDLEPEVVQKLKERAARHRRSTEAEHREILREAVMPRRRRSGLKELLKAMPSAGRDSDFARKSDRGRKVGF